MTLGFQKRETSSHVCLLISHVYWWRIKRRSQQQLKAADKYRRTQRRPEQWTRATAGKPTTNTSESTDTPRTELVDRVALGVGFDAGLWYFIWLCWFDCVRSSILPDVSDILQKHFALLAWPSTHQNFNGCLMVLMHHLNADPDVKGEGGACGGSMHGIWKSDDRGTSRGEERSQNADTTLGWNIKCLNLSEGHWTKRDASISNGSKLTISQSTFQRGSVCKKTENYAKEQNRGHAQQQERSSSKGNTRIHQRAFVRNPNLEEKSWNMGKILRLHTTHRFGIHAVNKKDSQAGFQRVRNKRTCMKDTLKEMKCLLGHCSGKTIHLVTQLFITCRHELFVQFNFYLQKEQKTLQRTFEQSYFIYANRMCSFTKNNCFGWCVCVCVIPAVFHCSTRITGCQTDRQLSLIFCVFSSFNMNLKTLQKLEPTRAEARKQRSGRSVCGLATPKTTTVQGSCAQCTQEDDVLGFGKIRWRLWC